MRRVVAASVCFLAVLAAASSGIAPAQRRAAAAAPAEGARAALVGWSDQRILSIGQGPVDLAYNFARAIAVDAAGRGHVVWYEHGGGKERAYDRRSTDAGKNWEDAVCLSDASEPMPNDPLLPAVAASGDDVYAV
jgi:hypothetical protein